VNKKIEFKKNEIKDWFAKLLKDTTIIKDEYLTRKDSINLCDFCNNINFTFVEDFSPFFEIDNKTKFKNGKYNHYTARIVFSEILYYRNEFALVYLKIKKGTGIGGNIYGFIFKKKRKKWVIKDFQNDTL
jgi:hypothetical protein